MDKLKLKKPDGTEYPAGKIYKFKDIYIKASEGGTPSTTHSEYYDGGTIPFANIEDLKNKYLFSTEKHITEDGVENSSAWKIPANNIIFSNGATIGEVCINKIETTTKQGVLGIIPKSFINVEYLYYVLKSKKWQDKVKSITTKGTMDAAYLKDLNELDIYIHDIEEQNAIVELLAPYETQLSNARSYRDILILEKKSMMQKIFNQEVRFKKDDGSDFENWEEKALNEIGELTNGISKSNEFFGHGNKMINLQDIFEKTALYDNNYELVEVTNTELEEKKLQKGDVLFIRSSVKPSGVGLPSVIMEDMENVVFSGFIIRCRFNYEININYKKYCFLESNFRNELLKKSTISANTNINQPNLGKLKVKLPSLEEQEKIANCLSNYDTAIETQNKIIEETEKLYNGLLQRLF